MKDDFSNMSDNYDNLKNQNSIKLKDDLLNNFEKDVKNLTLNTSKF